MGFVSFAGRVLFASVFLLSAYQDYNLLHEYFSPTILLAGEFNHARFSEFGADGGPAAKALEPKFRLFIKNVSSHLGIAPPHIEMRNVIVNTIALKGLGGLLFIFSSSLGAYLLLVYLAFITPIAYDLYNYDIESKEFVQLFSKFAQNTALFGALIYFLAMKSAISKRQLKKKTQKSKTN